MLDGAPWTVDVLEAHQGTVALRNADGDRQRVTVRALMHHRDCRLSSRSRRDLPASDRGRQPKTLKDLTPVQQKVTGFRLAHLLEVETGHRSGDPLRPAAGEPKSQYDPARTPLLSERRRAKVAELAELQRQEPEQARMAGLDRVSLRTLERWAARYRRWGVLGCADDRWLRPCTGHYSITEPVREAIFAVRSECLRRSRVSMATKVRMIHQYVRERFGEEVAVPSAETLRVVWLEWFGPGGARARYARSAASVHENSGGGHVVIHRPGQVVALDTTPLPVLVRETVFSEPVEAHLTLALCAYTHSVVAFRLSLVSEKSVDVAMVLRDVMTPLPMRAAWGEEMAWPYPGVPRTLVADLAGYKVAGLPFFPVETVTTDHGSVYKNHHLVEVQRVLGCNILPSRTLRPTDKQAVERAFGAIQSLLFELLPGYRGVDVADRGADVEGDTVLTLPEMEHAIATWVVGVWQNRILGEHGPSWEPGGEHSPNSLFAAAMAQGGFSLEIPRPELYYELLPVHYVKVHPKRGVKIRGLWYTGPELRETVSTRGGRHPRTWVVRSDPRDARTVFYQDPDSHEWHELRWRGLPEQGEVPSFNDARVTELLREAKALGIRPRSDAELLPLLLRLIGTHVPVDRWTTQLSRSQRKGLAREEAQRSAALADRPAESAPVPGPGWAERERRAANAVDGERRLRREQIVPNRPAAPARLGERLRRSSLLAPLPDEDDGADDAARALGEVR
ncbi:transposase [Kitasatospora sp. NPDC087315]|uniref:transposase n=1 Tax=Kitasatospora sp. NPDC087315 TaxID=3364069 RepID=UPI00382870CA